MSQAHATRRGIPMSVGDVQKLITVSSEQVRPNQCLRELAQNGIDACMALPAASLWQRGDAPYGSVEVLPVLVDGVEKLAVRDTGRGMGPEEILSRLNAYAAIAQSDYNFGVGSKVALAQMSPEGVRYRTLRAGVCTEVVMGQTEAGWSAIDLSDGDGVGSRSTADAAEIAALLPPEIVAAGHGTEVVVLGTSAGDPSFKSLQVGTANEHWTIRYLNERYAYIPAGITLTCKVWERGTKNGPRELRARKVMGSKYYLEEYSRPVDKGATGAKVIQVGDLRVRVQWHLRSDKDIPSFLGIFGNVRVAHRGEIYHSEGSRMLNEAGMWRYTHKAELLIEVLDEDQVKPDIARGGLSYNKLPFPIAEICAKFSEDLPQAIQELLAETRQAPAAPSDRLDRMIARYTRSRRSTSSKGRAGVSMREDETLAREPATKKEKAASFLERVRARRERAASKQGRGAGLAGTGSTSARKSGAPVPPALHWVRSEGAEGQSDLAGVAARYLPGPHSVLVNQDHPFWVDLLETMRAQYKSIPGAQEVVADKCRDLYTARLQEVVISTQYHLTADEARRILTDECLTATVAGTFEFEQQLKRALPSLTKKANTNSRRASAAEAPEENAA